MAPAKKKSARATLRKYRNSTRRWSVKAILPSGAIGEIAGGLHRHRDARKVILDRSTEYRARFGIELYASIR